MLELQLRLCLLVSCDPLEQSQDALEAATEQDIVLDSKKQLELVEHDFCDYHIVDELAMLCWQLVYDLIQDGQDLCKQLADIIGHPYICILLRQHF